uniref:GOLD domain-containing protein n=1 Tax=Ciona savignyi TaxID=51511 RepID=H2ZET5_CIOSA
MFLNRILFVLVLVELVHAQEERDEHAEKPLAALHLPDDRFLQKHEIPDEHHSEMEVYNSDFAKSFFTPLMKGSLIHEFITKLTVGRSSTECFFEGCDAGSEIIFGFEMNTGAHMTNNGLLECYAKTPNGTVVNAKTLGPTDENSLTVICSDTGDYEFCLDNSKDRLSSKVVTMHILAVHRSEYWGFHLQKGQDDKAGSLNYKLYDRMFQLTTDISSARLYLEGHWTAHERDWDLINTNYEFVNYFSLTAVCLFVIVGYVQTLSIKRMFNLKDTTASGKSSLRL